MENSFVKDKGRLSFFNWGKSSGMVRIAVLTALMAVMILGMTAVAFGADMENQGDGQEDGVQVLETVNVEGDGLQDGGFQVYYPPGLGGETGGRYSLSNNSIDLYNEMEKRALNAWDTRAESISIEDFNLSKQIENYIPGDMNQIEEASNELSAEISPIYYAIVQEHPEYFYVKTATQYNIKYNSNGLVTLTSLIIKYTDYSDEQIDIFNNKINQILSEVLDNTMTKVEMILALHEYIVLNCEYGNIFDNDNDWILKNKPHYFTAYGALVDGEAVCQGYSLAYGLLLDRVGIDNYYVASDAMNHAWNIVEVDGSWYHVDTTQDDPIVSEDILGMEGFSQKTYFMLSDATIQSNSDEHFQPHHGYTMPTGIQCNNDKYEKGYAFNGIESPMYYLDGYFYYIKGGEITKSKLDAEQESLKIYANTLRYLQFDGVNLYFPSNGNQNVGGLSRYNIATGVHEFYEVGDIAWQYGLGLKNGNLFWVPDGGAIEEELDVSSHGYAYTFGSPIYYDTNGLAQVGDLTQFDDLFVSIKNNDDSRIGRSIWIADYDQDNKMINVQTIAINSYEEKVVNLSKLGEVPVNSAAVRKYFILNNSANSVNAYEPWSKTLSIIKPK